jgi:hypothetical protein
VDGLDFYVTILHAPKIVSKIINRDYVYLVENVLVHQDGLEFRAISKDAEMNALEMVYALMENVYAIMGMGVNFVIKEL